MLTMRFTQASVTVSLAMSGALIMGLLTFGLTAAAKPVAAPTFPVVTLNPSANISQEYEFARVPSQDGLASYSNHYLTPATSSHFAPRGAKQCGNVQVPLTGVTPRPRDQGSLGLCFAYTAADLVSQRLGRPVSALDGAFRYFQSQGQVNLAVLQAGGSTAQVVVSAERRGFCPEKSLPSDALFDALLADPAYRAGLSQDDLTYIAAGFGWEVAPAYASGAEGLIKYIGQARQAAAAGDTATMQKIATDIAKVLPVFQVSELLQLFQQDKRLNDFGLVNDVFNRACDEGGRVLPTSPIHSVSYTTVDPNDTKELRAATMGGFNLLPIIDANLDKGRMVAITYQVDQVVTNEEELKKLGFANGPHFHSSSIVARQFDDQSQECEYQIRNSWGVQCQSYAEPFKSRCQGGYFWVTESELAGMMIETSYLE